MAESELWCSVRKENKNHNHRRMLTSHLTLCADFFSVCILAAFSVLTREKPVKGF